jgi:hypothetical protein
MLRLARLTVLAVGVVWVVVFFAPLLAARLVCGPNLIYDACGGSYFHGLLGWLAEHRQAWLSAAAIYLAAAIAVFPRQFLEVWRTARLSLRVLLLAAAVLVLLLITIL